MASVWIRDVHYGYGKARKNCSQNIILMYITLIGNLVTLMVHAGIFILMLVTFIWRRAQGWGRSFFIQLTQCYFQLSPGGSPRIPNSPQKTPKIQKTLKNVSNLPPPPPDMCFPQNLESRINTTTDPFSTFNCMTTRLLDLGWNNFLFF